MRHRKHSKDSAQSETPSMHGNSTRENREAPSVPIADKAAGRLEKAMSQESNMHADGESDGCVVPTKCPNKGGKPPAEGMEGRSERSLAREPTSRKRMDGNAPWALQPWRIRSFSTPW